MSIRRHFADVLTNMALWISPDGIIELHGLAGMALIEIECGFEGCDQYYDVYKGMRPYIRTTKESER